MPTEDVHGGRTEAEGIVQYIFAYAVGTSTVGAIQGVPKV